MKSINLQDNLYWLFMQASIRAKKGIMTMADELDLTIVQFYALLFLEPSKPTAMKDIADFLNCDASNVTGIMDRLFSGHYIIRQENPQDRRIKMVSLTADGEKLRGRIIKALETYHSDRLERLTKDEQQQLRHILSKILE